MIIVILSGKKQVGKDLAAKHLVDNFGFTKISYADYLKELSAKLLSDITGAKIKKEMFESNDFKNEIIAKLGITNRQFLQYFGTNFIRDCVDSEFWVKGAIDTIIKISTKSKKKTRFVITDARFSNEIKTTVKLIKEHDMDAAVVSVRINREPRSVFNKVVDRFTEHKSETGLDFYSNWDIIVDNYSTKEEYLKKINSLGWVVSTGVDLLPKYLEQLQQKD